MRVRPAPDPRESRPTKSGARFACLHGIFKTDILIGARETIKAPAEIRGSAVQCAMCIHNQNHHPPLLLRASRHTSAGSVLPSAHPRSNLLDSKPETLTNLFSTRQCDPAVSIRCDAMRKFYPVHFLLVYKMNCRLGLQCAKCNLRFEMKPSSAVAVLVSLLPVVRAGMPDKIYGVNLGSWLVLESWMLPAEWEAMGGESCSDCSTCIATEFAFAQAYPKTVDATFKQHWETWFTQDDVNQIAAAGLNTVRIPLGYWIVEDLVDRTTEFYPRGGLTELKRGLSQLKAAGISAILDHHALPGVQTPNQQFAGQCTSNVQFYTEANYHRALVWTAVMATLAHLDPDFATAFAIEAVNGKFNHRRIAFRSHLLLLRLEPIMDANQTPDYGTFQQNFVKVVRAIELIMGIPVPGYQLVAPITTTNFTAAIESATNVNSGGLFTSEVVSALQAAIPILNGIGASQSIPNIFNFDSSTAPLNSQPGKEMLVTNFMDVNWQYDNPPNPANAAIGPAGFDNHLYYSFGGVADANEDAYLASICHLSRILNDATMGDSPLWFGEWSLATQWDADDDFLHSWADAQKLAYSLSQGWIYWNFKVEQSDQAGDLGNSWSYMQGLQNGYFTQDPSQINNGHVCDGY
ncbi:hypothetical protein NM688_g4777 [Phlebia brevispora]|uniref:Uncharacterized protein n=1 Tax=Phlebia brevispora TaxID=194682 RepID=A0ACC1T1X2_9APHY|nr:hypothetical protein NM688_g4777 [Phlebia brevispora]